jgi:Ca2+-transporting ATPase
MGNATTICSDKTGTLTQNKMTVVAGSLGTVLRFGNYELEGLCVAEPLDDSANVNVTSNKSPGNNQNNMSATEFANTVNKDVKSLLKQSIVQNTTAFETEANDPDPFIGSKTKTALLSFAREHLGMGDVAQERSNANIVQVIPFDSAIKCSGAVAKLNDSRYRLYVKGASEILLGQCSKMVTDVATGLADAPMTEDNREMLEHAISTYASCSLRTISLVYCDFQS